ncbi:MAG: hypothetical protein IPO58_11245 [Betaproteobacteria bacterium]|nr:hypothetical protein [Betaproteobacteria bacterium]
MPGEQELKLRGFLASPFSHGERLQRGPRGAGITLPQQSIGGEEGLS